MTPDELRARAVALQLWLDAVTADVPWPPLLQAMIDRCRDDLALALAATEPDTVALLEGVDLQSFEALRGLLRRQ